MSKERPFEDITPVPNIKVGYFEKEEYLKIIDRQEKQIETSAYQIMALQSRIEILEKNQRPQGEWNYIQAGMCVCPFCGAMPHKLYKNYCAKCGAELKGGAE